MVDTALNANRSTDRFMLLLDRCTAYWPVETGLDTEDRAGYFEAIQTGTVWGTVVHTGSGWDGLLSVWKFPLAQQKGLVVFYCFPFLVFMENNGD